MDSPVRTRLAAVLFWNVITTVFPENILPAATRVAGVAVGVGDGEGAGEAVAAGVGDAGGPPGLVMDAAPCPWFVKAGGTGSAPGPRFQLFTAGSASGVTVIVGGVVVLSTIRTAAFHVPETKLGG